MESPSTSKPQPTRETRSKDGATRAETAGPTPSTPGPVASFVRFVVCGGGVGLLAGAAVPLLATLMPWALANAVVTVVSTLLCTELHALVTFGTGRRPGLREHLQSAGSATAAYVVTCAAMAVLHTVRSSPDLFTEQVVYLGASALAGTGRFLILRLFVFAVGGRNMTGPGPDSTAATRGTSIVGETEHEPDELATAGGWADRRIVNALRQDACRLPASLLQCGYGDQMLAMPGLRPGTGVRRGRRRELPGIRAVDPRALAARGPGGSQALGPAPLPDRRPPLPRLRPLGTLRSA
ncbi:hypothetical protein GCM10010251_61250 [Streptomyces aurantiogriseus]|uniref:GtrA-like protein domain-containing protein n=1 Tax=Streptomyces aurantiogriseus TaxID=66870 RepID=A0A918KW51_9ACTN|nr:hypothetical protein GCM10010251_61250 [Streptomyces aurantiogriseus]